MPKNPKTFEKRQQESEKLLNEFLELGIALDHPGTQKFIKCIKEFTDNGIGSSGIILFEEYERVMQYIFSMQQHVDSRVVLQQIPSKKPKINLVTK